MTEELVTVEEAAKILKVRRETIRQYIKNGHRRRLLYLVGITAYVKGIYKDS